VGTLSSLNDVGFILQERGELDEAESYYREALDGCRRVLGDDHELTLTLINNMGFVLQERGELDDAESYYREGLDGCRRVLGDNHSQTLTAIHNMGAILRDQRKLGEAELYLRQALEGCRRVLGDQHRHTLTSIQNLAHVLYLQRKLDEAERYCREALEGRRRAQGDDHPDTLFLIQTLGMLLWEQGRPDEAEPYYRAALEGRRRVPGDGHTDTLKLFNSTATLLHGLGKLEEAESLFAQGAHAARSALGDHPLTALLEHHDAGALRELGRLDEALDLAHIAIERYRAHPEWVTSEAVCARRVLAAALHDAGREAEAFAVSWEGIQVGRRLPDTTPARLASALARFAQDALAAGDRATLELAEQAARESLEIRRTELPDGHPQVWLRYNAMSMLGDALVRQASEPSLAIETPIDKLREAEPLLLESAGWLTRNGDCIPEQVRDERLRRALERVVELYEVWYTVVPDAGKAEKAAEWRAELEHPPGK
jgi:non-specific serine/threonine protein kinase/serine/threonine-protein kinase